jgi:hypothetical protein
VNFFPVNFPDSRELEAGFDDVPLAILRDHHDGIGSLAEAELRPQRARSHRLVQSGKTKPIR